MVVVDDAQCLDHVGDGDAAVADEQEVPPVPRPAQRGPVEPDPVGAARIELDLHQAVHSRLGVWRASCGDGLAVIEIQRRGGG